MRNLIQPVTRGKLDVPLCSPDALDFTPSTAPLNDRATTGVATKITSTARSTTSTEYSARKLTNHISRDHFKDRLGRVLHRGGLG